MNRLIISIVLALVLTMSANAQTSVDPAANKSEEMKQLKKVDFEKFQEKRAQMKESTKQKREEFKKTIEAKRETLKGGTKAKGEDLKKRLTGVKDEKKRQSIEKIDQRLGALNEKMLNHFSAILEKLEEVLEKISSRADKAEAHGMNVSPVRDSINEARTEIAAARTAIVGQTGKTYTIVISTATTTTSGGTLKSDVGKARQALHADLVKVREKVFAAREAVKKAAVALAQIPKVDELGVKEETASEPTTATSTQ